ncbi:MULTISPECIES: hypothetical protein [unclassified Sphingomonas]|uniref:hypothetical protein n=1 Tax=unclassified Sphingomonas TaxID=196159 RepID=UPI001F1D4D63|nr:MULTISPECIES: hypothetical protein [unclassified Sphingomonas]
MERLAGYPSDLGRGITVYYQSSESGRRHVGKWECIRRIYIFVRRSGSAGPIKFATLAAINAIISYGGDPISNPDPAPLASYSLEPDWFMVLIVRPVPENSILKIVRSFSTRPRDIKLVVLSTDQSTVIEATGSDALFTGAICKTPVLHAMRFFPLACLHVHRLGGTKPSLGEAPGAGSAVIAHDNPFNRRVVGDGDLSFADETQGAVAIDARIGDPARRLPRALGAGLPMASNPRLLCRGAERASDRRRSRGRADRRASGGHGAARLIRAPAP